MTTITGEDWYGTDLGAVHHVGVTFIDVDLTEVSTSGALFDSCVFRACRFNASTHVLSAVGGCTFDGVNVFDATFEGCKLTGSELRRCTTRPMKISDGVWQGISARGADLGRLDLSDCDLRDADLSMASLAGSDLRGAHLEGALLRSADLSDTDLRGAHLDGADLTGATLRDARLDLAGAVVLAEQTGAVVDPDGDPQPGS